MRKMLSLIIGISAILQIIFGSLMLAQIGDLNIRKISGSGRDAYTILIILAGVASFWIALFTFKNPAANLSKIIVLAALLINFILLVINGWSNSLIIISLSINIIELIIKLYLVVVSILNWNKKNKIVS